jgi:hypothetical protein
MLDAALKYTVLKHITKLHNYRLGVILCLFKNRSANNTKLSGTCMQPGHLISYYK